MEYQVLQVVVNDANIDLYSRMQRMAYRCISMLGPSSERTNISVINKKELIDVWSSKLFEDMDYRITFDESVWMPDDPGAYGNIMVLYVMGIDGYSHAMHIDFRDPWHYIFNVEYIRQF